MKMGIVNAKIGLKNPTKSQIAPLEVDCLVDTGAWNLCLPEHIAIQLGYDPANPHEMKEIVTADGKRQLRPYVGPIIVSFKNRSAFTGAMVMGDVVLLGAIPMEDMDLVVIPRTLTLEVNPDSPNIATGRA